MITTTRTDRRRKSRLLAVLAAASLTAAAGATTPAPPTSNPMPTQPAPGAANLPSAESIFEKYVEAIGGRETLDNLENRRIRGFYEGELFEFKAQLRIWWEKDGRYHQQVSEPAGLRFDIYRNGEYTWAVVQDNEPKPLLGFQRQELIDTADFLGEANYKERYKEIQTIREAKAGDTPIYVVRAVSHSGRPHLLFFDKETGLIVGNRVPVSDGKGGMRDLTVRLQNYEDAGGGVLYPTRIVQEFASGSESNVYEFASINVNTDDAHDYTVPPAIKEQIDEFLAQQKAQLEGQSGGQPGGQNSGQPGNQPQD